MTAAASPPVAPLRSPAAGPGRWQRFARRRPEWWLSAVAAAGWLGLAAHTVLGGIPVPQVPGSGHGGHSHPGLPNVDPAGWSAGLVSHAVGGVAMVAVMTPLIALNVRHAAMRSPRRFRAGVTAGVVAGWALVWAGAAIVLGLGAWLLGSTLGQLPAVALLTAVAVGWQYSPLKRRSLARCHGVLAPPLDRRQSRRACRRYGVGLGRDCVLSCWALMAVMAVATHNPLVVASTVGVAWYERRRRPHHDPATRATAVVIAATGAAAVTAAYLSARYV